MTASHRIALNTLATYARTFLAMALGLFSGRWVLESLGPVDYGLMGVVGALVAFITLLNGVSAHSASRFLAFSVGKADHEESKRWFNTALSMHIFLAVSLVGVGYPLGEWAILGYGGCSPFLNIPVERVSTALCVFHYSLGAAFIGMVCAPYAGMFMAKQRIFEMSLLGVLQTLMNFFFVYMLTLYKGDSWLFYSGGTVLIFVFISVIQVIRARHSFPECQIHFEYWLEKHRLKQVFSFSFWQLFSSLGILLKSQGSAILLNKYFPPSIYTYVNASYSVGNTVAIQTQTLSMALLSAFTPEITACEGRGDRQAMLRHANRASKFGAYLVMLFAIPVLLETDYLLLLWLKNPPALASTFCKLVIVTLLTDKITFGCVVSIDAKGKIAGFKLVTGLLVMLTLPLAWIVLSFGFNATVVGWSFVLTNVFSSISRLIWARYLLGASVSKWLNEVLAPCAAVMFSSILVGLSVKYAFSAPSVMRLFVVSASTLGSSLLIGWIILLAENERKFFLGVLTRPIQFMQSFKI